MKIEVLNRFPTIKAVFMDMDGVLTDGYVMVTNEGDLIRQMHVRDGYAIKRGVEAGLKLAIISAGYNEGAVIRFKNFGIHHVHMRVENKLEVFKEIMQLEGLASEEIMYMGDDVPDIECLKAAGIAVCPADAMPEVMEFADMVTQSTGGKGAVRESIEMVLRAKDLW